MSQRGYSLYRGDSCFQCLDNVRKESSAGRNLCLQQYDPDTFERFTCINANDAHTYAAKSACLSDAQCCEAASELPPATCNRCTDNADSIHGTCTEYCFHATNPGVERGACLSMCNATQSRQHIECYELGLCDEHCALPSNSRHLQYLNNQ
jgi:hypothetical protein